MSKSSVLVITMLLACIALAAQARVYRWVDEKGNVQYSDSLPPANAKNQIELDQQGMVRKVPEKKASAGEIALKEAEKQAQIIQKRRDQALLQSFSRPEEIDYLRDRQINAVDARVQTNKLRRQGVEDKLKRLTVQMDNLVKAKRAVPESVKADWEGTRKELAALDVDMQKLGAEIAIIKEKAEADKARLIELRGFASGPANIPGKH